MNAQCPDCLFRVQCLIAPDRVCVANLKGTMGLVRAYLQHYITHPTPIRSAITSLQNFLLFWGRPAVDYRKLWCYISAAAQHDVVKLAKDSKGRRTIIEPHQ